MEKIYNNTPIMPHDLKEEFSWIERYSLQTSFFKNKPYHFLKRSMDIILVLLSSPIWVPLIAMIAVLIKIDSPSGPIIFRQLRTGYGGKQFWMYKFRTMVPNAEEMKKDLLHLNKLQWPDFKITNDPRITRIGRLLRRTSLDELPQLFNVLIGEMSLVGPRPTSFSVDTYKLWHTNRLDVKPGITGLWQIIGRGSTEFDDRLKMDIAYIEHRCLRLDIEILIRTVLSVLVKKGAY